MLGDNFSSHKGSVAVVDSEGSHSYEAIDRDATAVARALVIAGLRPGGVVATVCSAGHRWLAGTYGVWRAGGVLLPLEPTHPPADLHHPVTDSAVSHVLCTPESAELATELAAFTGAQVMDVRQAILEVRAVSLPVVADSDDAMIVYTSGTTGLPKGVVHTHRSLAAQCGAMATTWGWSSTDRILGVLPLHHVHGLVNVTFTPLSVGAVLETAPRFDPVEVWDRLASGDITVFMAVPTIYTRLAQSWKQMEKTTQQRWSTGVARLRLMVSGSAALPVSTLEEWQSISGHVLLERYGMTELGMALGNTLDRRAPGHVGWPFPGVEVRIVDDHGIDVVDGAVGELLVRGAQVFDRYLHRPDATDEAFVDGWFRTGDVAQYTPDGYRLLGRASVDILKTGGEKVSALEIEESFRTHPAVADCAVVGLPDEEWGERVAMAWVQVEGEHEHEPCPSDAQFREWGKQRLAPAKVPFVYLRVDSLPRNQMGKVTKAAVKELF